MANIVVRAHFPEMEMIIQPQRCDENGEYNGGRYSCRKCGNFGNALNFLWHFYGLTYPDAYARLRITPKYRKSLRVSKQVPKLQIAPDPPKLWMDEANSFVNRCHAHMLDNLQALALVTSRGLTKETAVKFKIGYSSTFFLDDYEKWGLARLIKEDGKLKKLWLPAGIVIPTFAPDGRLIKVKVRRTDYEKEMDAYNLSISKNEKPKWKPQKYVVISGSKESPSVYGDTSLPVALILESELDAILVQQEASDLVYCVALGGNTKPLDLETSNLLKRTSKLLFCPDYDSGGANAWARWKNKFSNINRILTPSEKSAGDYFLVGGDLRQWLKEAIQELGDL